MTSNPVVDDRYRVRNVVTASNRDILLPFPSSLDSVQSPRSTWHPSRATGSELSPYAPSHRRCAICGPRAEVPRSAFPEEALAVVGKGEVACTSLLVSCGNPLMCSGSLSIAGPSSSLNMNPGGTASGSGVMVSERTCRSDLLTPGGADPSNAASIGADKGPQPVQPADYNSPSASKQHAVIVQ